MGASTRYSLPPIYQSFSQPLRHTTLKAIVRFMSSKCGQKAHNKNKELAIFTPKPYISMSILANRRSWVFGPLTRAFLADSLVMGQA
ncbi:hypothetical protein LguiA_029120 [Lonicera macranthoides]